MGTTWARGEVELTRDEWMDGIQLLTATRQARSDVAARVKPGCRGADTARTQRGSRGDGMKMLDCHQLLMDCDVIFTGVDDDEVVRCARTHIVRSHDVSTDDASFHERLRNAIVSFN